MKNAPNLELSLLARQWGASAVPFSEPAGEAWLETPHSQRALAALDQTATLRSVLLLAGPKDLDHDGDAGHKAAGQGKLDYSRYLSLLHTYGFKGPLLLHGLSEAQVPGCIAFLREKMPS